MPRIFLWTVLLAPALLSPSAGCVRTTRTPPPNPEPVPVEVVTDRSAGTVNRGARLHGVPAPSHGVAAALPDVPQGPLVHRSGVTFPEQVGPLRRVRAYQGAGGAGPSAEYADGSGRLRIVATLRDRAGRSAAERYEQVRAEAEAAGHGSLPAAAAEGDSGSTAVSGWTEAPAEGARGIVRRYRVEERGPDFLEFAVTCPASDRDRAASAFDRFRSELLTP